MMGKLGGIVLILMLLMWCCNTRKTVVEFNLIGSSGMLPELEVNGEEWDIQVDDSGYAKLMLTEGEHGYATLKYGKDRLPLFIEDGMTLRIYIYGDHAKGNIRFEGDGAPKNRYLNSQVMKNLSFDYELDGPEFLGQLKDLIQEQFHYLDTMGFDTALLKWNEIGSSFLLIKHWKIIPCIMLGVRVTWIISRIPLIFPVSKN